MSFASDTVQHRRNPSEHCSSSRYNLKIVTEGDPEGQQIPVMRREITKDRDWKALAEQQCRETFTRKNENRSTKQIENMIELVEYMCQLEDDKPACASAASDTTTEKLWIEGRRLVQGSSVIDSHSEDRF